MGSGHNDRKRDHSHSHNHSHNHSSPNPNRHACSRNPNPNRTCSRQRPSAGSRATALRTTRARVKAAAPSTASGLGVASDPTEIHAEARSAMPESQATPDHYQTLGVARNAPAGAIKKAYRKLARQHHPDVSKAADAHVRMAAVNAAHQALSDPETRAAYDEQLNRPPPQPGSGRGFRSSARSQTGAGFEFFHTSESGDAGGAGGDTGDAGDGSRSDFFEQIFGGGRGRHGSPVAERGADQTAPIELDLLDAYEGAERSFSLNSTQAGVDGRLHSSQRVLAVRIPRGIRAGQQIRLAGSGGPGRHGGPAGDLLLAVNFKPDARWRAEGRDVFQRVPLSPWEAALGATANIATPSGEAEVSFPAGWQPGRKLRLKDRGIPGAGSNVAGHLYLELELALPAADNEAQRAAYIALAHAFPAYAPRGLTSV